MGNYGNNLLAIGSHGRLIYVDEPEGGTETETEFDGLLLEARDNFIELYAIDGVYQPGILSRAIKAIVKTIKDDDLTQNTLRHKEPRLKMKVPNDSSIGITAEEFVEGQTVSVPPRKGMDARPFRLLRIMEHNAVWVTYEIK